MKILQNDGGFSQEELRGFTYIVYGNTISQMKILCGSALKIPELFDNKENVERAERLVQVRPGGDAWTNELALDIKHLWKDSCIQKIYSLPSTERGVQLNDSAQYFFDNIDRFMSPTYIPTQDDVLRVRVRSTGIEEAMFSFEDIIFRMMDVGGQRSERRKWIHCFDQVTAVIFCVGTSEYDQYLREDVTTNRMRESLNLYEEMANSKYFRQSAFILFLNKVDLLEEKIKRVDLKVCFENYTGGANFEAAKNFIKQRFLERSTEIEVVVHFTCAVSTDKIKLIFSSVKELILKKIIQNSFVGNN